MNNENIENNSTELQKEDRIKENKPTLLSKKVKFICYAGFFILSLVFAYFYSIDNEVVFNLGDFGSLLPLLGSVILMMNLKWCPIFSVIGAILLYFDKKFQDFSTVFFVITSFVSIFNIILFLCLYV